MRMLAPIVHVLGNVHDGQLWSEALDRKLLRVQRARARARAVNVGASESLPRSPWSERDSPLSLVRLASDVDLPGATRIERHMHLRLPSSSRYS